MLSESARIRTGEIDGLDTAGKQCMYCRSASAQMLQEPLLATIDLAESAVEAV